MNLLAFRHMLYKLLVGRTKVPELHDVLSVTHLNPESTGSWSLMVSVDNLGELRTYRIDITELPR
ncbi:hypothetical protein [Streptomyces sp. NPDC059468]|uniref:hypothetical protein n=1 Tax=Streptomyces sp. NPDC059468 TaxID=3346845 RepID=UPI0036C5EF8E